MKVNQRKFIKDKMSLNTRQKTYIKLNMAIKLRCISGKAFLNALLRRIELAKEMFILEIETGQEVFIPKDLTFDSLPYSMRYYDPIIAYVQENVSEFSRS